MAGMTGTSSRDLKHIELVSSFSETIAVRIESELKTDTDSLTTTAVPNRNKPADSTGTTRHTTVSTSNKTHSELIRHARNHSHYARDLAEQLVEACETDSFMDQFRIGNELDEQLKLMWKYRKGRDEMWGKLLNFLQSAIKTVDFDKIVTLQAKSVFQITEMLASSYIDRDDIQSAKSLLMNAGLDHWFGISEQ